MVLDYTWNGLSGKIEKLFIKNVGGSPLTVNKVFILNDNGYLSGEIGNHNLNPNLFYHYLHPWIFFPNTIVYNNTEPFTNFNASGIGTVQLGNISVSGMEIFPDHPNSIFQVPLAHPVPSGQVGTIFSPNTIWYQYYQGPHITHPQYNFFPNQAPKLFGLSVYDYYRIGPFYRQTVLEPFDSSQDTIEFILGCFPKFSGTYNGKIVINYDGPDGNNIVNKNTVIHLTLDKLNTTFSEMDKTATPNIFSIEGIELEGQSIELF